MTKKHDNEAKDLQRGRQRPMSIDFSSVDALPTLAELEKQYVLRVLDMCQGSKIQTYRILGIDRKTLYRKLVAWGETWRLSSRRVIDRTPASATVNEEARTARPENESRDRRTDAKRVTSGFDTSPYIHRS